MVTQVSCGLDSRVNLSWIQTGSMARQSMGKSFANLSRRSPAWSPGCSPQHQPTTKYSTGQWGLLLLCRSKNAGKATWRDTRNVCVLPYLPGRATCPSPLSRACLWHSWMQHPEFTKCHPISPQNLSSSCCCVLLLLLLTTVHQILRIMCPLAATATQFIQLTSNPEAGLAGSLICTKPRTNSSQ